MRILIVSTSFKPMISARAFRTTELVRELAAQGHEVDLLTYKDAPEHSELEEKWGFQIIPLGKRLTEIELKGKSGFNLLLRRVLRRVLLYLFQYPQINIMFQVKKALKPLNGYDLMISIATPHPTHWGVALARTKGHPIADRWIADSGDPFMMAKYDNLGKPFYLGYLENAWSKKSDFVSIPRIAMRENYYPSCQSKILEIPQGFKFPDDTELPIPNNPVPTFAFAGTFMRVGRNPQPLLEVLSEIDMDFRFIVYTKRSVLLDPYKERLGNKLEIHELVPRDELLDHLQGMDFLINIGFDAVHQSPSKLIDYYIVSRPVLSFETSEVNESKLLDFLKGDYKGKYEFGDMSKFRIEKVTHRFLDPQAYILPK